MAGYQSFFSGSGGGGVTPATKTSGASYSSFFGTKTIANPTQQQLQTSRAQQAQQANQQRLQQQQQQQAAAAAKANSGIKGFLNRNIVQPVVNTAKAAGNTIASDVYGAQGTKAGNQKAIQSNQAATKSYNASIAPTLLSPFTALRDKVGQQVKYLASPTSTTAQRTALLTNQATAAKSPAAPIINNNPSATSVQGKVRAEKMATNKAPVAAIQQSINADKQSVAASNRKALGTAVAIGSDVVGGGSAVKAGEQTTKNLLLKGTAKTATSAAVNNTGSTLSSNPNATGKELATSAATGAVAGGLLHGVSHVVGEQAGKVLSPAVSTTDAKTGIQNARVRSLIEAGQKQQAAEAPPLEMKAAVNPQHVKEGLINPEIKQTPVSNLAIPADNVSKLNASKVNQYSQQIKDGETLEPIVTHDINGTTHVVDGQHRLAAAQKLGIDTVPTVDKVPGATPLPPESTAPVAVGSEPPAATAPATPVAKPTGALPNEAAPAKAETPSPASVEPKSVSSPNDTAVDTPATAGVKTTPVKSESNVSQSESSATTKAAAVDQPSMTAQPSSKVSGSALKAEARAAQAGVVKDLGDKAQYDTGSYKNEEARAEQLVKNDPERAKAIALGQQPGDNPIHEVKVRQAVEKQATKEEDVQTLLDLGKSNQHIETSAAAQRMGAEGHGFDPNSPVARIKELNQARQDAYKAKTGKSANAAAQSEIKQIRAATPKATVTKETFSSFVESLRC